MTSATIAVAGTSIRIPCEAGQTVLDAAERAGFALPYACRKGVCSSCRGGLVAGTVATGLAASLTGLHEDVLYCVARPQGDVEIAPQWIVARKAPERRRYTTVVHRIERPTDDVALVHLRLPIGRRMLFAAGQYVKVFLDDGETRNYSLANAPQDNDMALLHVRRVPGGRFSDQRLRQLSLGDRLDIEAPYGLFALSADDRVPVVLLGTGTGFSSLRSMIADLMRRGAKREVHLFWGGRRPADLYELAQTMKWAERHPWLRFMPVLSQPPADWHGATGKVQAAALAAFPDLRRHEVYACGSAAMVDDARALLTGAAGLAEDNFYADPYVASGDLTPLP